MNFFTMSVANRFVQMGVRRANQIDLLRLVLYVYFAKGWHFALYDEPLFYEKMQAWKSGVIVPSVYYAFKHKYHNGIGKKYRTEVEYNFEDGSQWESIIDDDNQKVKHTLEVVWTLYESDSSTSLLNLTKGEDSLWKKIYVEGFYKEIPDADVKEHFKKKKMEYLEALEAKEK